MRTPSLNSQKQTGNVLFLVLIAVALFAALSYAVTQSGRGAGNIDREKAQLDAAKSQQCTAGVEYAVNKLKIIHHCADNHISYELLDGTNENPANPSNKSCFVFDPEGAGATACGAWLNSLCSPAAMAALSAGQKCDGADIVYVGIENGSRLYTTLADQGNLSYNAGGYNSYTTGATSASDGMSNTNTLVAVTGGAEPYQAALACRSLGSDWYLPAINELVALHAARHTGLLNGTFDESASYPNGGYWTSTEADPDWARVVLFTSDGATGWVEQNVKNGSSEIPLCPQGLILKRRQRC